METAAAQAPPLVRPVDVEKRIELILDALKRAITEPGEHRLFRSGKLTGLFPSRVGSSAEASLQSLSEGLLETVRTELKGKLVVEWVRITPRGVAFVHDRDSPKAILRELKDLLGNSRSGVPGWMDEARREIATASQRFDQQAAAVLWRLDALAARVEAALRRVETAGPSVPGVVAKLVPWSDLALDYLDRREAASGRGACPLAELFQAIRDTCSGFEVPDFQTGLRRLHDVRAVRLTATGEGASPDPEFAILVGATACYYVSR